MAPQKHKTEFNTKTGKAEPLAPNRNSVEFDVAEFMHFLEGTDWTLSRGGYGKLFSWQFDRKICASEWNGVPLRLGRSHRWIDRKKP